MTPQCSGSDPRKRDEWLVRSAGGDQVGPVCLELIERGIHVGRVPQDAQVARVGSGDWWPVRTVLPPPAPVSYASAMAILDDSIDIPKQSMATTLAALGAALALSLLIAACWIFVALVG